MGRNIHFTAEALMAARKKEIAASGANGELPSTIMEDALFLLMPWTSRRAISDVAPAYSFIADMLIAEGAGSMKAASLIVTDLCERVAAVEKKLKKPKKKAAKKAKKGKTDEQGQQQTPPASESDDVEPQPQTDIRGEET